MPSILISQFAGISPAVAPKLLPQNNAQIAHNCLLTDGRLRPYAKWIRVASSEGARSLVPNLEGGTVDTSPLGDAVLCGVGFPNAAYIGANYEANDVTESLAVDNRQKMSIYPAGLYAYDIGGSVTYTRGYFSDKPVQRAYAFTLVRDNGTGLEESSLYLIPDQCDSTLIYEGDFADIVAEFTSNTTYDYVRIYRTITGLDTGEKVTNSLDTEWHLVVQLPASISPVAYSDGGAATTDPLDVCLSAKFYPVNSTIAHVGITESGWLVAADCARKVYVSERFMQHAWPSENVFELPNDIRDMAVHYDNVYVGTGRYPFVIPLAPGEQAGLQGDPKKFPEPYACKAGTMDVYSGGVVYTAPQGVVGLSRQGQRVLTGGLANMGDVLYNYTVEADPYDPYSVELQGEVRFDNAVYGLVHRGLYYVQTAMPEEIEVAGSSGRFMFVFDIGDEVNGVNKWQQLVTMDSPPGLLISHRSSNVGLFALTASGDIYLLPLLDNIAQVKYETAEKYCYRWKSKKFVFPGITTLGAAKVSRCGEGYLRFRLYVDCCCVFETVVCDGQPFRLPEQTAGVDVEIELIGTAEVSAVHVASTMRELA